MGWTVETCTTAFGGGGAAILVHQDLKLGGSVHNTLGERAGNLMYLRVSKWNGVSYVFLLSPHCWNQGG